jgi:hypothetical protein
MRTLLRTLKCGTRCTWRQRRLETVIAAFQIVAKYLLLSSIFSAAISAMSSESGFLHLGLVPFQEVYDLFLKHL